MCRMVGYRGEPVTLATLVFGGGHSLADQSFRPRELLSGHVNADGFGVVWFKNGAPLSLKEHRPIWQNPELRNVTETIESGLTLAAVRNVTPGIDADASGTPPVVRGGLAVALNGYLEDFQAAFLREMVATLSDSALALARGLSDTEFVCLEILDRSRDLPLRQAVETTVSGLLERATQLGRTAQMNLLVSAGGSLIAVRASNAGVSNSLYLGHHVSLAPDGVIVASEPLTTADPWEAVPHNTIVDVGVGGPEPLTRVRANPDS